MANIAQKTIKYPGLPDIYTFLQDDTTLSVSGKAADAKATGDALSTKAEYDGYYEDLGAGTAEQLISTVYDKDKVPYSFRTSGGSADIGNRVTEKIIGGTVAWNQLIDIPSDMTVTSNGLTGTRSATNKTYTVNGTSTARANIGSAAIKANSIIAGHKYYIYNGKLTMHVSWDLSTNETYDEQIVAASASNAATSIQIECMSSDRTYDNVTFYPQLIDLTQMFGSTIADYVYSLETATAGAGVAWFKALFPKDYYAYNAGELMSVQAARKETVGFNQWDGTDYTLGKSLSITTGSLYTNENAITTPYIPCVAGQPYYVRHATGNAEVYYCIYDANKTFISGGAFSTVSPAFPTGAAFVRFSIQAYGAAYNNDICINLSWSGYRNGEYEAYKKNTYALDDSLELRGIPKLDASNQLYWDGDEYASDGSVTRRAAEYTFTGTEPASEYTAWGSDHTFGIVVTDTNIDGVSFLNEVYASCDRNSILEGSLTGIWLRADNHTLYVSDASLSTAAEALAKLTGTKLVYTMATPTDETADPYTNPQIVDDFGTEEFIDAAVEAGDRDVSIPVGHESQYMANLRDKLQHLPDLASANGTYVIAQSNSQMTLTPLTTPTELPAAPTTDGTYKLRVVVASGTPTYSWVSDT